MIEFFDQRGQATAFCERGTDVYLWDGRAAAFIHDDRVFAYSGRFIGWVDNGWISDADGHCLLFEFDAVGGPAKPNRGARPSPGARGPRPPKGAQQAVPPRPKFSSQWSERNFSDLI